MPPNGQGIAALLALDILDGLRPAARSTAAPADRGDEARLRRRARVRRRPGGDCRCPVGACSTRSTLAGRRALIGDRAGDAAARRPGPGGTVYLCTADADGMMVSLIQSNYMGFGSYVVVPGHRLRRCRTGAPASRSIPATRTSAAPGKRPFHTIIPGFLTRGGAPVGPFGVMGGHMQPQGHVQVVLATVDDGLDPQAALDAPRWYWHAGRRVAVEPDLSPRPGRRRCGCVAGHEVTVAAEPAGFGYGQAIWRSPDGGLRRRHRAARRRRRADRATDAARPRRPARGAASTAPRYRPTGPERGPVGLRRRADPAGEVVAQRGRVAEAGAGGDRVDAEVGLLQQPPREQDALAGEPVVRGGAGLGPEPAGERARRHVRPGRPATRRCAAGRGGRAPRQQRLQGRRVAGRGDRRLDVLGLAAVAVRRHHHAPGERGGDRRAVLLRGPGAGTQSMPAAVPALVRMLSSAT